MERRGLRVPFDAFIRVDSFFYDRKEDQALLERLRNIGMISSYLGLESRDDETLKIYNKKIVSSSSGSAFSYLETNNMAGPTNGCITFHQEITLDQIKNSIMFFQALGLCTFWNVSSRAGTLPGIPLNESMETRPRQTPWDVKNYRFLNQGVGVLNDFVEKLKTTYEFIRFEDSICRRLKDALHLHCFYTGSRSEEEDVLNRRIRSFQENTATFLLGIISETESCPGWTPPKKESELFEYVAQWKPCCTSCQEIMLT